MKNIKYKMGTISLVITAVVIACVIILNILVGTFTERHPMKIDLTQDKIYEFSQQTKDVMKNLDSEIKAYAIVPEGLDHEYIDYIKSYLEKYRALSKKFSFEFVDPYVDTAFLNNYTKTGENVEIGSVIIECGSLYKVVPIDKSYTQSYFSDEQYIEVEKHVTNAIMSVTGLVSDAKIYFNTGHQNEFIEAYALEPMLSQEGYVCGTFNSVTDEFPEDANIVFSIYPARDYTSEEIEKLDAFLDRGGRFVLVGSEGMNDLTNLNTYLKEWGLELSGGYVIEFDKASSMPDVNGLPVPIAKLREHTITSKLTSSSAPLVMPNSSGIITSKSTNGADVTELLTTSEKAIDRKTEVYTASKEEGDIGGPVCLAAISQKTGKNNSMVMVAGSLDAICVPSTVQSGSFLNGDFILNSVSYMSGVNVSSDIRAKKITPEAMVMTTENENVINIIILWVIPAAIILIGFFIWIKRRFK